MHTKRKQTRTRACYPFVPITRGKLFFASNITGKATSVRTGRSIAEKAVGATSNNEGIIATTRGGKETAR